ncbi:MAG: peptidoglycan DD-metalloendopeptidase family protein [Lachnospiraceae bacterium]
MKEKLNQMFKDKLFLVMLVLGLLTIVAAAGVVTMQNGSGQEQNPYVDMQNQQEFLAEESDTESQAMVAGESNATLVQPETKDENEEHTYQVADSGETSNAADDAQAVPAGTGLDSAKALMLNFSDSSKMIWPVKGNVILDYNMESTIYFPTLDQYKCNPALIIQGAVSDPVYAPANARVLESGFDEEIGNYLKLDMGNEYALICGQLKEVSVVEGEYLEQGQLMGYIAEPTKYYSIEGSNVFVELMHQDKTLDPLDYLE